MQVCLKAVTVSTQGLQVSRVIVPVIPVYVVHIQLAAVFRHKAAVLADILLVDHIWVLAIVNISFIDSLAPVATSQASSLGIS
jgi:hypothetical protein